MLRLSIGTHRNPNRRLIAQATEVLRRDGIACYPTDSVYALGCAVDSKRAAQRIYRARDMQKHQRLAMLCPDISTAAQYAQFSQTAFRVARTLCPGPFTLVLPATRAVPRVLLDHRRREVGIRIPNHPVPLALMDALGDTLLTTSAVPPGAEQAAANADALVHAFRGNIDVLLDAGPIEREPSTVLRIVDDEIYLLRAGCGDMGHIDTVSVSA